jgi:hypothetical protein
MRYLNFSTVPTLLSSGGPEREKGYFGREE